MEYTKYLGLHLPGDDDFVSEAHDRNNFRIIDAELKKSNNNSAAIKEALQILSSNVLIVDDVTGAIYKIGSKSGKLYFTQVQENSIQKLARNIDTDASTVGEDTSIRTLSLVSLSNIVDVQIEEAAKVEEDEVE